MCKGNGSRENGMMVGCNNCRWNELITIGSRKDMVGSLAAVALRTDTKVETDTKKIKLARCRTFPEFRTGTRLSFTLREN